MAADTGLYPTVLGHTRAWFVIHEAFGLNDNIRDVCHRFADEGYAALGVDRFEGRNRAVPGPDVLGTSTTTVSRSGKQLSGS